MDAVDYYTSEVEKLSKEVSVTLHVVTLHIFYAAMICIEFLLLFLYVKLL